MKKPNNADQQKYWSSPQGQKWIRFEADLDAAFQTFTDALLATIDAKPGERILDIGCGTGDISLSLAKQVGEHGAIEAFDIAEPLLERARDRAQASQTANIRFQHGDAQKHRFVQGAFDVLASRFGVMFFAEPVTAFANMKKALKPDGRMIFACWSGMEDNPWFRVPRDVAIAHLGKPKPFPPRAPGPLAFSEPEYVSGILEDAGYKDIKVTSLNDFLVPQGGLDGGVRLASQIGMAQRIMFEYDATKEDFEQITTGIRSEFSRYLDGDILRVPAVVHLFEATV